MELSIGDKTIIIESGKIARQANASVTVTCGGTTVLVAVCMSKKAKPDIDFFPLMVEYQEKIYAAGRIPGGFLKREARPSLKEVLTARIIDRPLRPLFPEGFYNDVVVTCLTLSFDKENDPDVLALLGASAALTLSDIPFDGPIGALRLGMLDDDFILNPTLEQREQCQMELIVAGHENGIVMIEGEAKEVSETKVVAALNFANEQMPYIRQAQIDYAKEIGKAKSEVPLRKANTELKNKVMELTKSRVSDIYKIGDKKEREDALHCLFEEITSDMTIYDEFKIDDHEIATSEIMTIFDQTEYEVVRELIFVEQRRADGRGLKDIREITSEIDFLQKTHGSSLFTRGQTQSLAVVTLGTRRDEQLIESLTGVAYSNFLMHYNFPAFSVGEARGSRGPGRREFGHGALAAKAIKAVLPSKDDFPYTIRIVSEILESNGSSSMASVCAGILSLMAAGVPISNPVAGISIGLVSSEKDNKYSLLTDIMGLEDHFGDMDYKIAGSKNGITAIQLDIKIKGLPMKVLSDGIDQAKEARIQILDNMLKTIDKPRAQISDLAPGIVVTQVPPEKIGEVIGPGGKVIKRIMEETGAESIDIDDDGKVFISGVDRESVDKALKFVNGLVEAPVVGKLYDAVVVKVMDFGAFCEFLPGKQGLVHISEMTDSFVKDINTITKPGDRFKVKLVEIDKMHRVNLSKKLAEAELK